MCMNYLEEYKKWMNSNFIDETTKSELKAIQNDDKEIQDRFYKNLEFGTAGLRGVVGAGTNRMDKIEALPYLTIQDKCPKNLVKLQQIA